jgi:hypothetical protein
MKDTPPLNCFILSHAIELQCSIGVSTHWPLLCDTILNHHMHSDIHSPIFLLLTSHLNIVSLHHPPIPRTLDPHTLLTQNILSNVGYARDNSVICTSLKSMPVYLLDTPRQSFIHQKMYLLLSCHEDTLLTTFWRLSHGIVELERFVHALNRVYD